MVITMTNNSIAFHLLLCSLAAFEPTQSSAQAPPKFEEDLLGWSDRVMSSKDDGGASDSQNGSSLFPSGTRGPWNVPSELLICAPMRHQSAIATPPPPFKATEGMIKPKLR